ncbi:MAG TPA: 16S rRNA (cytidine(1402)-2'-O)-methyltransferase [Acidimicrobiales bacterium]|jgi:16S rRNA (cytidine1402-2'-O)-methyltransferase|nr:16S rRNA (cytidine(1402)-2'-O)-methyltransferase [Acidimicrobiales bacterium]
MTEPGRLVVVGTPIGNLEDMSPRGVRALREATTIYCEDTRRTRKLLSALAIPAPPLHRLDRHTERNVAARVCAQVEAGAVVAVVSDAGMPTISDPGSDLVKGVASSGLPTEVVPGPCAVSAALALSGFPAGAYRFAGFLPRKGRDRNEVLETIAAEPAAVVVYESPHRVAATIADLAAVCGGDREVAAAKELTKLHEQVWRGPLSDGPGWFAGVELKGEWVIVVGPRPEADPVVVDADDISVALAARLERGTDRRTAVAEVAQLLGQPKRVVYQVALTLKAVRP